MRAGRRRLGGERVARSPRGGERARGLIGVISAERECSRAPGEQPFELPTNDQYHAFA